MTATELDHRIDEAMGRLTPELSPIDAALDGLDRRVARRVRRAWLRTGATLATAMLMAAGALMVLVSDDPATVRTGVAGTGFDVPAPVEEPAPKDESSSEKQKPAPATANEGAPDEERPSPAVDDTPPGLHLDVASPHETDDPSLYVTGSTEPGAVLAVGATPIDVDADGRWGTGLSLAVGKNTFRFVARDAAGNTSVAELVVHRAGPPPAEKPAPVEEKPAGEEWAWSAAATYGSCNESPPYDVYYGSTAPGRLVKVLSEYGSGQVEADAEGHWELRVEFPESPVDQPFVVKVTDGSHTKKLEFVRTAAE